MGWNRYDENGDIVPNKSTPLVCTEESITEQHHESETNINAIIARNGPELQKSIDAMQDMRFDDVTGNDFQEIMDMMITARESFDKIPSEIRNFFGNDPAKFVDFVNNPNNNDKLIEWGLANEGDPPAKPTRVVMVDENDNIIKPTPAEAPTI